MVRQISRTVIRAVPFVSHASRTRITSSGYVAKTLAHPLSAPAMNLLTGVSWSLPRIIAPRICSYARNLIPP